MGTKTLTRADIADAVVRKTGISRQESQQFVEVVLDEISGSLESGESVKLSSFGSFGLRQKGERVGRNPKTGEEVPITPRRVLFFKPSNLVKNRINDKMRSRMATMSEPRSRPARRLSSKNSNGSAHQVVDGAGKRF